MNWKLILLLSLFGLAMSIATVSSIPLNIEPVFWLVIFVICAYIIAKNCSGKYFLHGFLVSMVNSVWITAAHVIYYDTYMANHPEMVEMNVNMPLKDHSQLMMIIMGPIFGVVFGLILGLFSFISGKIVKKNS